MQRRRTSVGSRGRYIGTVVRLSILELQIFFRPDDGLEGREAIPSSLNHLLSHSGQHHSNASHCKPIQEELTSKSVPYTTGEPGKPSGSLGREPQAQVDDGDMSFVYMPLFSTHPPSHDMKPKSTGNSVWCTTNLRNSVLCWSSGPPSLAMTGALRAAFSIFLLSSSRTIRVQTDFWEGRRSRSPSSTGFPPRSVPVTLTFLFSRKVLKLWPPADP